MTHFLGALSIQPKIPVISVGTSNGTDLFRFGPTGIFGTSFEGGPTVTGLVISAVYDICRLQTADC